MSKKIIASNVDATNDAPKASRKTKAAREPQLDFRAIAEGLVQCHHEMTVAKSAIEADYQSRIAGLASPFLTAIQEAAKPFKGITEKQYNELLAPHASARYEALGYKDVSTRASILKVAFIAAANGVKPSKDAQSNVQRFVNEEARPTLRERGILKAGKASGAGRPKGSTSEKVKSDREKAAECLAQTGGVQAIVVDQRVKALLRLTTAGNWKLLERVLADALKTLGNA